MVHVMTDSPLARVPAHDARDVVALPSTHLAPRPTTLSQTGLSATLVGDLLSKHLAAAGVLSFSALTARLALAGPIVEEILHWLRKEGRVEVRARVGTESDLRFGLTERGRADALDALMRNGYVGPAPVPLAEYAEVVRKQSVHAGRVTRATMHDTFRNVVIEPALLDQLGPALNSGRAIFIYGSAGTGKTFIAKRLAQALPGTVLVPHAVLVNETVIRVFDPQSHLEIVPLDAPSKLLLGQGHDPRYVRCERPVIVSGGELTADMLELRCDPRTHEYTAPVQMKANNGLLLIDDLGRQRIDPQTLFNRWIVPMEEQCDYLTGASGQHFRVPFDLVLVFSTNLDPAGLADEAFLRRIGSKISFKPVSSEQYRRIWDEVCAARAITCEPGVIEYVIQELYGKRGRPMLPCHPRDLLGMALDFASYCGKSEALTAATLQSAWETYFVEAQATERLASDAPQGK
jgi:hypothetical protein